MDERPGLLPIQHHGRSLPLHPTGCSARPTAAFPGAGEHCEQPWKKLLPRVASVEAISSNGRMTGKRPVVGLIGSAHLVEGKFTAQRSASGPLRAGRGDRRPRCR